MDYLVALEMTFTGLLILASLSILGVSVRVLTGLFRGQR